MKAALIPAIALVAAIASATAHADETTQGPKTRAQVRAELVQAREAGLFNESDATYPAAQLRAAAAMQSGAQANTAFGGVETSRVQSGRRMASPNQIRDSIYFGQ
jgi:hypothetical protein